MIPIMNSLAKGLGWLGLALILAPLALFCLFVAVAVTPQAGFVLLVVVVAFAAGQIAKRRKG
jgi:magnesium-transporting ATPase (P-type)